MDVNIFAYSNKGCELAKKILILFPNANCYTTEKLAAVYGYNGEKSVCHKAGELFNKSSAMIFVGACGIAVRAIAPFIKNKMIDPAVVVIDDCGNYVISLLSGHIGGANELSSFIAKEIGATPVITTATDVNGRFSVDSWAVKNSLTITSMKTAKDISAQILVEDIPFTSDIDICGDFPNGLVHGESGKLGIYVSYKTINPFDNTLHLVPKILHVGIGCKKYTTLEQIEELYRKTLDEYNIDLRSIKNLSSIDLKKDEEGLLKFADKYKLPVEFYTAEELNALSGEFTPSSFVKGITGVDNVCERAAYKSSEFGSFIVRKTSKDGVTIAICAHKKEVCF